MTHVDRPSHWTPDYPETYHELATLYARRETLGELAERAAGALHLLLQSAAKPDRKQLAKARGDFVILHRALDRLLAEDAV